MIDPDDLPDDERERRADALEDRYLAHLHGDWPTPDPRSNRYARSPRPVPRHADHQRVVGMGIPHFDDPDNPYEPAGD